MIDHLDRLADLQHDLGKHMLLPLALLPSEAGADAVAAALRRGLLATRSGPAGTESARAIWRAFWDDMAASLGHLAAAQRLAAAVDRALAWEERLHQPIDRGAAQADLAAVSPAIRALMTAVQDGDAP